MKLEERTLEEHSVFHCTPMVTESFLDDCEGGF